MASGTLYGFAVVFLVIGGLELFDRTSFALIAFSSRASGLGTWVGGCAAFVLTTLLAVLVGAALTGALGPERIGLLRAGGGAFLIGYALWTLVRKDEEGPAALAKARSVPVAAFLTIMLLEVGDTTMIFEIVFVANFGWLIVLAAGSLGLVAVATWDVWLGRKLGARVNPKVLRRVVVAVLILVGAVTIVYGLAPEVFPVLNAAGPG